MTNLKAIPRTRLLSLDVFRGLTVAAMILVNNPGDWSHIYAPLEHAEWNGCTPTDLIFPFFLFIVGVSISYALGDKIGQEQDHSKLMWTALKRALILFGLGLFLAAFPTLFTDPVATLKEVRIPGILQRISLVFFISALIFIKTKPQTQFKIMIGLLILYWLLMTYVPVPGLGYANLEKETNLGAWIDRTLLGEAHLWKLSVTWDPEGILGTIPAVSTGLFGVLAGSWLKRKDREESVKIAWMFSIGLIAIIAGLLWNLTFPINKALWTGSYVLYTGGLATIGLALCYWLIDVRGYQQGIKPFVAYGINALAAFFLSTLVAKTLNLPLVNLADGTFYSTKYWLYKTFVVPLLSPLNASLAMAITYVVFWFLILWFMYTKRIIIKI